jgi:hypothetical protein
MAMFNDLFELLADLPTTLMTGWAVWVGAGVVLMAWFRRARLEPEPEVAAPRPASRPRPGRTLFDSDMTVETSVPDLSLAPASGVEMSAMQRTRPERTAVIGDPFGDLATLLDQPGKPAVSLDPRPPADSPILNAAGSPIRRANTTDDSNLVT